MLFHVTMTHTPDNCPSYWPPEKWPEMVAAFDQMDAIAKDLNIKVHFFVNTAPGHVSYALLEAESQSSIISYTMANPVREDYKIVPVTHQRDLMAFARDMMTKMSEK